MRPCDLVSMPIKQRYEIRFTMHPQILGHNSIENSNLITLNPCPSNIDIIYVWHCFILPIDSRSQQNRKVLLCDLLTLHDIVGFHICVPLYPWIEGYNSTEKCYLVTFWPCPSKKDLKYYDLVSFGWRLKHYIKV